MAANRPNPTLSDDLISEILKRVPVKSLLCFQSVCKTWLSLIKHPAFIKSQLSHALTTQTDQSLIAHEKFSLLNINSREIVSHLKFPHPPDVDDIKLVGSANGIVCVAVRSSEFDRTNLTHIYKTDIYLWNPAIRRSKHISSLFSVKWGILGFGYDGVDDDYKIVCLVLSSTLTPLHIVYSDNNNAWRNVPEPIDDPRQGAFDVCINGFLCGLGRYYYGMVAFDLNKGVLNCGINLPVIDYAHAQQLLNCAIKLPAIDDAHVQDGSNNYYDYDQEDATRFIEFNNSVAVIMLMDSNEKINMWTLDDDVCLRGGGVEASWTPMFSIDLGKPLSLIHGYFSNGNLLLVLLLAGGMGDIKMLISCNADKKEAKIAPLLVDMADYERDRVIYKYTESLVSLAGFRHVNYNVGENDN